ncbi:hypothetical protein ACH5RR_037515 [Cinchona calisaya]|uniref:Uncharacterized protein n=1 Tax=Cinchona calisaya TaxID=153742 RepID=A0ABD2Y8N5_9GENT
MAINRIGVMALLFCGMILAGAIVEVKVVKACPLYCLDVNYMTCGNSETKLRPYCNCCLAPKGCTLHLADGTSQYCG